MPINDAWQPVAAEVNVTASTTATSGTTYATITGTSPTPPFMCVRICNKSDKWNQVLISAAGSTATTSTGVSVPPNACIIIRVDPSQNQFSSISIGAPTSGNISVQPGNGGISP